MVPRTATLLVALVLLLGAGCVGSLDGTAAGGDGPTVGPAQGSPDPATAARERAAVTTVVDGDTVRVEYRNGTTETVRLIGVDSPEVGEETNPSEFEGVPDTAAGRACLRSAASAATDATRARLSGKTVGLGYDPVEPRRDFYDRLLAYLYVDGDQFNYWLVAAGHARVYDSGFVERTRYEDAERRARAAGRGLWACADDDRPTGTATGTTGASLEVSVHPDAAGNDNENPNDEYVTLSNAGNRTLELSGWTVTDEAGAGYAFPAGTTLAPGGSLRLHTGVGTDGDGHYYWGRTGAVWNNDGDTVTVRDAGGNVVATRSY